MLMGPGSRLALGSILGLALLAGLFVTVAGWYADQDYRHVRVALSDIDDIAKVAVNCRTAFVVGASQGKGEVDLGLLSTDDAVTVSVFNKGGDADWRIHATSNGKGILSMESPQASAAEFGADEHTVVMVQSFTAGGRSLGPTGCARPLLVSSRLVDYRQSPEAMQSSQPGGNQAGSWPRMPVLTTIEKTAPNTLVAIALLGFGATLAAPGLLPWIRKRWQHGFVVGLLGLVVGLLGLVVALYGHPGLDASLEGTEAVGVALLAIMAYIHARAGLRGLRAAKDSAPQTPEGSPGRDSNS
jgi:hypothetical protein